MLFINYLKRKNPFFVILGLLFGLSSCGSYQYVGVDNDGIYRPTYPNNEYQKTVVDTQNNPNTTNSYYQNYFRDKSLEYDTMTNGEVFTDIDSYEGNYVENNNSDDNYQGYAGWGQNNSSVTINYIDNGFNNWGWNRWNNWGWNAGFGLGWNNWGWNRWNNWGYYDNFWYRPHYYGSYNGYRNRLYSRRDVAYNASRRGGISSNYNTNLSRRTGYSKNSNYSTSRRGSVKTNSNTVSRYNRSSPRVYTNTQRRTTTSTPASNSTRRSSSVRRNSTPTNNNYNKRSTPNSSSSRNYSTRRSSSPSYSKPASSVRSSSSRSSRSSSASSSRSRR